MDGKKQGIILALTSAQMQFRQLRGKMIFVQQVDTRKKCLRKSDQHRMVKSTPFGTSGHFISEMDMFISPFLILSVLQNKWMLSCKYFEARI
ncbi:hypothetical protein CEXT_418091 [Caerostris extrusa]|uniref:Uncharacterized protein n=1 Tax=Caerostris extrusa TaxID=172846 RepID=A0AAV4R2R7_CAEEX|nr:hypothetical protein CEXT_418091 [Caerostris extrusa]